MIQLYCNIHDRKYIASDGKCPWCEAERKEVNRVFGILAVFVLVLIGSVAWFI